MSGGSYDYGFRYIEDLAIMIQGRASGMNDRTKHHERLRLAFAETLISAAKAAKAIEWCDSLDTSETDSEKALESFFDGITGANSKDVSDAMAWRHLIASLESSR